GPGEMRGARPMRRDLLDERLGVLPRVGRGHGRVALDVGILAGLEDRLDIGLNRPGELKPRCAQDDRFHCSTVSACRGAGPGWPQARLTRFAIQSAGSRLTA